MSDADFKSAVEAVSKVIDGAGVVAVVVGMLVASIVFLLALRSVADRTTAYRDFRQQIGRAILLGLEFLVAADIIRTVAVTRPLQRRRAGGDRGGEDVPELHARRRARGPLALAGPARRRLSRDHPTSMAHPTSANSSR